MMLTGVNSDRLPSTPHGRVKRPPAVQPASTHTYRTPRKLRFADRARKTMDWRPLFVGRWPSIWQQFGRRIEPRFTTLHRGEGPSMRPTHLTSLSTRVHTMRRRSEHNLSVFRAVNTVCRARRSARKQTSWVESGRKRKLLDRTKLGGKGRPQTIVALPCHRSASYTHQNTSTNFQARFGDVIGHRWTAPYKLSARSAPRFHPI